MTSAVPAIEEGVRVLASDLEEQKAANAAMVQIMAGSKVDMETPEGLEVARDFLGKLASGGGRPEIEPQLRTISEVPVRIFVPETVRGVYLHVHGGGWAIGTAAMMDVSNSDLAKKCRMAVVSVDYRLAPEDPYPAGPDDCEAVARWLVESSESEFGTRVLLIGGESAGGNLAAVTLLRVRDRLRAIERFFGANLVYGAYDLNGTPSTWNASEDSIVLSRKDMEAFGRMYAGDDPEVRRRPDISPLYADLSGLPPALFSVGGIDPLLDDSLFMAARWQAAGSRSELAYYPECPHGFDMFPTAAGKLARERELDWIDARLEEAAKPS